MSYKWKVENVATNSMFFDDDKDVAGKGKYFKSRFLQPGLVKYSFGVCVLEKETIDKFVQSFVGVPVIIGHQDLTQDTAEKERVGSISNVWYNNADGWYWCDGIIFNDNAIDLIKNKNFNVSCQYIITEYSNNKDGKLYNANPYDKIILNGIGEHLAIVENARYQGALISVNAIELGEDMQAINDKKEFVTVGEGESAHVIPVDYLKKDKKETTKQSEKKQDGSKNKYHDFMKSKINDSWYKNAKIDYGVEGKLLDTSLKDDTLTITWEEKEPNKEKKTYKMNIPYASDYTNQQLYAIWAEQDYEVEEITTKKEEKEPKQLKLKLKNDIIQAINEIKENSMFKNLFKKEEKMDREEIKSIFMECLTELTASNEAEKKEEVKEEVKEEKEEVAENKCKNEEPDYKKMYEELKAEKEAKNEAEKEENEKAKNAIMEGEVKVKSTYITERRAIELGKELF